jgi:aspartyl-tRNA(Asn)/glutamyl-tRNA(Gln) amidotransferase subunit A
VNVQEAGAALRSGALSSVELTTTALDRVRQLDPQLNSFLTLTADTALAEARRADDELAAGHDRGPLHGIPIALKDLFLTRGVRTTGGSKVYERFVPEIDSAVGEKLAAAGAVMMGKLNMHELAYGITSANPHFGPVRNPWNRAHIPGGSSGGSGAAVAAEFVFAAMGSDTGGSIRIPASFCGTVGIKPTYGLVSRYGTLPLGQSLDHMGPLTRTVRDAALVLEAIAGHDRRDPASARRPVPILLPEEGCAIHGLRIGVPENFFFDRIDAEVEASVRAAIEQAEALGAVIKPVTVPDIPGLNAVARMTLLAEASAVLEPFLKDRSLFGPDVLTLLDQGRLVPAIDYVNAQRLRRRFRREFDALWTEVDCLVTPATPAPAPRIGDTTVMLGGQEEDVRLAATRLVRGINPLGLPALAMPCGLTSAGLPIGLQIVGRAFDEATLLKVGAVLEDAGVGRDLSPPDRP